MKCYFDHQNTQNFFQEIIENKNYNFSRYNFFLANYLLFNAKDETALKIIQNARKENSSNLLIKEAENYLINGKKEKIKSFFDCKKPNDSIAEFFYVIANLHSSEQNYKLSNFYFKFVFYCMFNFKFIRCFLYLKYIFVLCFSKKSSFFT